MNKINETFNQYMDLEKSNNQIDREIQVKGEEFEAITKELDQNIVGIFLRQMVSEEDYKKAMDYFKKRIPFSLGFIAVFNLLINLIFNSFLFYGIPNIIIGIGIYFGLSTSYIKDRYNTIKTYQANEHRLTNYNSGIIERLREIKALIKSLDAEKKLNTEKMKELEGEVVRLLAAEMEEEYRKQGIEEQIDIEEATIVANTKNRLQLNFRKGEGHE